MSLEEKIARACIKNKVSFEILFTSEDGVYDFLRNKIEADHITDVVICGGDGSLRPVIAATLDIPVNIGILPLGSGNGLARTVGIPSSADKALQVIMKGRAMPTDGFLVNRTFCCHACGLGFDAQVAHDFAKQKKRGLQGYTRLAIRNFFSATTYPFVIEYNGGQIETDAFLICIANSNQFGNNFKIAPRASVSDGLLDIVILRKRGKAQMVLSFVKQILSGEVDNNLHRRKQKDILYFQTPSIKIRNPKKALLHIDGDPAPTASDLDIEIVPSCYRLIQP